MGAISNDHHGEQLRSASFRDMNLNGADFTAADLRGADFSGASLVEADFSSARLGVPPLTGALILLAAILVSIAAGLVVGFFVAAIRGRILPSEWQDLLGGWILLAIVLAFLVVLVRNGIATAMRIFLFVVVVALTLDIVVLLAFGEFGMTDDEGGQPAVFPSSGEATQRSGLIERQAKVGSAELVEISHGASPGETSTWLAAAHHDDVHRSGKLVQACLETRQR
jgi:hypothetical protein